MSFPTSLSVILSALLFANAASAVEVVNHPRAPFNLGGFEIFGIGERIDEETKATMLMPPHGNVTSLLPLVGDVFFETQPKNLEADANLLFVEVWAGVPEGDHVECGQGTLITSDKLTTSFSAYDTIADDWAGSLSVEGSNDQSLPMLALPQSGNGRVAKASFKIEPNPYDMGDKDQRIWFESDDPKIAGTLKFCVRVAIKMDYLKKGELSYVSYLDTIFKVPTTLVGKFSTQVKLQDPDLNGSVE